MKRGRRCPGLWRERLGCINYSAAVSTGGCCPRCGCTNDLERSSMCCHLHTLSVAAGFGLRDHYLSFVSFLLRR